MLLLIVLVVTVIAAAFLMPKKKVPMKIYKAEELPVTVTQMAPDSPVSFGYKCMWYAVKTEDKQELADFLELKNISVSNWQSGIPKAYEGFVFITPPID